MAIIDDEGRIFGRVNVIDALAVLFVASVVIAGVAVVISDDADTEPTSNATEPATSSQTIVLDLGTQPSFLVDRIESNETGTPTGPDNITISDVIVTPDNGGIRIFVIAEATGVLRDGTLLFEEAPLRVGRGLLVETDAFEVSGTIVSVGDEMTRETTRILVEDTVDIDVASQIDQGDTYSVAGRPVASVESVVTYASDDPDRRRVLVGLSLSTVDIGRGPQFGDSLITEGSAVTFVGSQYVLDGRILRVGATEPRGDPATRTISLEMSRVSPNVAEALRAGMTETAGGDRFATVLDVDRSPAELIVTGEDGTVYVRDHPTRVDLTLRVELRVRTVGDRVTFKGQTLQRGSTVVLDLEDITIEAEVASL